MEKHVRMSASEARTESIRTGKPVAFDDRSWIASTNGLQVCVGDYGKAYPCGCVYYTTVWADGSLGIGEWEDNCPRHFHENI